MRIRGVSVEWGRLERKQAGRGGALLERQPDGERAARARRALHIDAPAVRLDNGLGQVQPLPDAAHVERLAAGADRFAPVEALKHVGEVLLGDTHTGVADADAGTAVHLRRADTDAPTLRAEVAGVVDQRVERAPQTPG